MYEFEAENYGTSTACSIPGIMFRYRYGQAFPVKLSYLLYVGEYRPFCRQWCWFESTRVHSRVRKDFFLRA